MTTAQVGYAHVHRWVKHVLGSTHTTSVVTVAWAVLCLLVAQRVTSAALARALPTNQAGSGRSCLRRVRRWWRGPALDQATISPALRRLALTLLAADQPVVVALDTTRLGPWEVWLAGIVVTGRPLPIGWAVIPYPWPKGRVRATTLALLQRLQQAFPAGTPWTLVAERGFPSAAFFAQWRDGGTELSVRLRLSDWVTVARVYASVRAHLAAGRLVVGQRTAATMGRGTVAQPLGPAAIVVSAAVVTPPRPKQNPGTARERAHRAKQHAQHRKHKQGRKTTPPQRSGPALCPDVGLVHHRVDGGAGGGRVRWADVDRRDIPGLASSLGRPGRGGGPANRGHGGTAEWDCLPRVYGAEAPRPAGKRRRSGPAAAGTMDRDGPCELVLVWPTAVRRPGRRLD